MNVDAVRRDFPILEREVNGKKLAYFDNAATSQKPRQVIEAMNDYYGRHNANVHRGIHQLSHEASKAWEDAHKVVGKFVNAGEEEVVFTKNVTEAINLVAYSLERHLFKDGGEIVSSIMEHHSNFVPWQQMELRGSAKVKRFDVTEDGRLDTGNAGELITRKTKLVALTKCSNVLGTINELKEIVKIAHENGALVLVDGAQAAPHMKVDVKGLGADFFGFTGHKMLGPTGIGALYGRKEVLEEMPPFLFGGDMISRVTVEKSEWNRLPYKFEAGTPNIAEGIGLAAAVGYMERLGLDAVQAHERTLTKYAHERLEAMEGVEIYGPAPEEKSGIVSFNLGKVHPHDVATVLDREGVAVRSGDHCGQPLMKRLGIVGTARASFYVYNVKEEIDRMVVALEKAAKLLG